MFDFFEKKVQFPERRTASLEDNLRSQAAENNFGSGTGRSAILASWDDRFATLPLDILHFTALNKRGCILVMLSEDLVPDFATLTEVIGSKRPWKIHFNSYLHGGYPILRANLAFPDNIDDPLWLEAPLDLCNGDIQDFCTAVMADEMIDVILKHQSNANGYHGVCFAAKGIAQVVKKEVTSVADHFKVGLSQRDFDASYERMMQEFSSSADGLNRAHVLAIQYSGRAKNYLLDFDSAGSVTEQADIQPPADLESAAAAQEIIEGYASRLARIPNVLDKGEGEALCRTIGAEIDATLGLEGMRQIVDHIRSHYDRGQARMVERAWDRIGNWLG
ncbi:MAG TPA: hypothetical protein PKI62_10880 [bacterium]|nr:hypothetical protein [bacterium]HPR89251.1 hypothetical protein [bacterium]